MTEAKPEATVIVKGNCGIPEFRGAEIHYSGTPELMADYVRLAVDAGARIIGGCCGTSFAHLAAMRQALDAHTQGRAPDGRDDRRAHRPDAQQAGDGQHCRDQRSPPRAPAQPGLSGPDWRQSYRSSRSRRAFFRISRAFSACAALNEPPRSLT